MSGRGARRSVDGHDAAFMSVTSATGAEYVYREFYLEVGNVRGGYGFEADLMRLLNEHFKFVGPNRAFEEQWGESTNSEALLRLTQSRWPNFWQRLVRCASGLHPSMPASLSLPSTYAVSTNTLDSLARRVRGNDPPVVETAERYGSLWSGY
jgi:hypothetical protein